MKRPPLGSSHSRETPFLLVHGFELTLCLALAVVAIVFTAFPDVLTHAPVGFEARGIIHHVWHYTLLVGALATLVGVVASNPRIEMAGLILLIGALLINLIAIATLGSGYAQQGFAIALRAGVLIGLLLRLYLIAFFLPRVLRQADKRGA